MDYEISDTSDARIRLLNVKLDSLVVHLENLRERFILYDANLHKLEMARAKCDPLRIPLDLQHQIEATESIVNRLEEKTKQTEQLIFHRVFARIERISIIHKDLGANRGHFYWPKSLEQYFSKQIIISSA